MGVMGDERSQCILLWGRVSTYWVVVLFKSHLVRGLRRGVQLARRWFWRTIMPTRSRRGKKDEDATHFAFV